MGIGRVALLVWLAGCAGLYVSDEEALRYYDRDGDGFPVSGAAAFGASEPFDCDDTSPDIFPGATERCNGLDDDCDGPVDEDAADAVPWFVDLDGDGHGSGTATPACSAPLDHVENDDDCDDRDDRVSPVATEICNDIDDDCDGDVDEDGEFVPWYPDNDGDGFGGASGEVLACAAPEEGWVLVPGDCDDQAGATNPDATEVWYDGVDQDCDGGSDFDQDDDGFDSADHGGDDCGDSDPDTNSAATEIWYDGADQDCSGGSDYDRDGDGYDSDAHGGADCDDTDPAVSPGAGETWYDGIDQNCAGTSDYDQDGDGHDADTFGGDDCDDLVASVSPGAAEVWYDGIDQDCSGGSDYDQDGDTYDSDAHGGADCDDSTALATPVGTEVCDDGFDNDCDGTANSCRLTGTLTVPTDADASISVVSLLDVSAGDTNGDGGAEVAVRVANAVMVYSPPSSAPVVQLVASGIDSFTFRGDYDADGLADLVVARSAAADDVWVLNGPVTNLSKLTTPDASYSSSSVDGVGSSIAFVGDLSRDGFDDLGVGASNRIEYVVGPFTTSLTWHPPLMSSGLCCNVDRPIAPAGDFDGDGYGDVVTIAVDLSANTFPVVFVPYSSSKVHQLAIGSGFRLSDTVLDMDDDGWIDDVAVADSDASETYLYFGAPTVTGTPDVTIDGAGDAVAVGDIDGDGVGDLAIVREYDSTDPGATYVFYGPFAAGPMDTSSADLVITGSTSSAEILPVVRAADVNGDGLDDVVIGTGAGVSIVYGSGF